MSIEILLKEFQDVAYSPNKQLSNFKAQGKKVVGVLPYYAPEELVYAAGMVLIVVFVQSQMIVPTGH